MLDPMLVLGDTGAPWAYLGAPILSMGTLAKAAGWVALEEKVMPRLGKRRVLNGRNGRSKGPEAGTT